MVFVFLTKTQSYRFVPIFPELCPFILLNLKNVCAYFFHYSIKKTWTQDFPVDSFAHYYYYFSWEVFKLSFYPEQKFFCFCSSLHLFGLRSSSYCCWLSGNNVASLESTQPYHSVEHVLFSKKKIKSRENSKNSLVEVLYVFTQVKNR